MVSSFLCRTTSSMTGNNWLYYSYSTFQIFSRSAVDGRPIQYGDVVGLKFPFGGYQAWMYRSSSKFYSKNCSYYYKYSCAAKNAAPGFIIFKKLWSLNFVTCLTNIKVKYSLTCNWRLCNWKLVKHKVTVIDFEPYKRICLAEKVDQESYSISSAK